MSKRDWSQQSNGNETEWVLVSFYSRDKNVYLSDYRRVRQRAGVIDGIDATEYTRIMQQRAVVIRIRIYRDNRAKERDEAFRAKKDARWRFDAILSFPARYRHDNKPRRGSELTM